MAKTKTTTKKRKTRKPRSARERTSAGQSQALWTFLIAIVIAIFALLKLNQSEPDIFNQANIDTDSTEVFRARTKDLIEPSRKIGSTVDPTPQPSFDPLLEKRKLKSPTGVDPTE